MVRLLLIHSGMIFGLLVASSSETLRADSPEGNENSPSNHQASNTEFAGHDQTQRVRELIYLLRQHQVFERTDEWASAIRELIEIGKPAVPELVAELERTDQDATLRALGFTLRGIGDPRAAPALIRAIPKLLRPPGSDCGVHVVDPELRAFMLRHDRSKSDDRSVSYGRPVNEILDALSKITGHHEPVEGKDDPLRHVFLSEHPIQQGEQRKLFLDRMDHWNTWWSRNWKEFVTQEELDSVRAEPADEDLVAKAGIAKFGPLFPTGKDVRIGPVQEVELESLRYWNAKSHFDFDTGRTYEYLSDVDGATSEKLIDSVYRWYSDNGIDMRVSGGGDGEDLHLWLVDNGRWDTIDDEVRSGRPLPLGREATDHLIPFGKNRMDFRPNELGTFLFTTREGGRGIVQVFPRAERTSAVRLQYRMWGGKDTEPAKADTPIKGAKTSFGPPVTVTLESPAPGKKFLFNMEDRVSIAPPETIVPPETLAKFSFINDELFTSWAAEHGADLAVRLSRVAFAIGAAPAKGPDQQYAQVVGLGIIDRQVLPDAFHDMTVEQAEEIVNRLPQQSGVAWMMEDTDASLGAETFVIKTRTGRLGLLQIAETNHAQQSIRVRYRLAEKPDKKE